MGLTRTVSGTVVYFALPLTCSSRNWVSALEVENYNVGATGPRKKIDDIFSRLDTIHERDRQTDRQTYGRADRETDRQTSGDSKDRASA